MFGALYTSQYARIEQSANYADRCAKQNLQRIAPSDTFSSSQETKGSNQENERQPDWCDLAAQQSMAESTRGMHWAAWATVAFTGIGAFLIWQTLLATQDTVAETRRIGEAQTRAYLSISKVKFEIIDQINPAASIRFRVSNTGNSPGKDIFIRLSFSISEKRSDGENLLPSALPYTLNPPKIRAIPDIPSGSHELRKFIFPEVDVADLVGSIAGRQSLTVMVEIAIEYTDVFEHEHSEIGRFKIIIDPPMELGKTYNMPTDASVFNQLRATLDNLEADSSQG